MIINLGKTSEEMRVRMHHVIISDNYETPSKVFFGTDPPVAF